MSLSNSLSQAHPVSVFGFIDDGNGARSLGTSLERGLGSGRDMFFLILGYLVCGFFRCLCNAKFVLR